MNKLFVFIVFLFFVGCGSEPTDEVIYAEYARLAGKYSTHVRIGHLSRMMVYERSLSELIATEEERLAKRQDLLKERVKNCTLIDSLTRLSLELKEKQCSYYRYNSGLYSECLYDLYLDSLDYVNNFYELERLKARKIEQQEQLSIVNELKSGWTIGGNAYVVVHTIELLFRGELLTDTLVFFSFKDNSHVYLDKNPFIEQRFKPE